MWERRTWGAALPGDGCATMSAMTDHENQPQEVRDVLAAEEFGVGTGDPALSRTPIEVPGSPSVGAGPAREVLAADAFAVPAGRTHPQVDPASRDRRRLPALAAAAAVLAWIVRRRR